MKARYPLSLVALVAVLGALPSGCSDDKAEGPKNNPQRNALPGPTAGGVTGTTESNQAQQGVPMKGGQPSQKPQPQQSAALNAVLTYEVCQGGKDSQPGQCTKGSSECTDAMVVPLEPSDQSGTLSGTAQVVQSVDSKLSLTGRVLLTQNPDGSYLLMASVGDSLHEKPIARQQQAGTGPLDQMTMLKVDSGKQVRENVSYSFSLMVAGSGTSVPTCRSPSGTPSQAPTPPEQIPPSQGPAPLPEPSGSPSAAPSASPSATPSASPAPPPLPVPIPSASTRNGERGWSAPFAS